MRTRTIAIIAVLTVLLPTCLFFGSVYYVEQQRIRDADPAFRPLLHLDCHIFSQPVAFHRHCRYVVEFPANCKLTDANVVELQSLNRLPAENLLDVTIHTPNITDQSLPQLLAINTFDSLNVTDTSISDDGIEKLRRAFSQAEVYARREK